MKVSVSGEIKHSHCHGGVQARLGVKGAVAAVVGSFGGQPPEELWAVLHLMPFTAPDRRRLMLCVR